MKNRAFLEFNFKFPQMEIRFPQFSSRVFSWVIIYTCGEKNNGIIALKKFLVSTTEEREIVQMAEVEERQHAHGFFPFLSLFTSLQPFPLKPKWRELWYDINHVSCILFHKMKYHTIQSKLSFRVMKTDNYFEWFSGSLFTLIFFSGFCIREMNPNEIKWNVDIKTFHIICSNRFPKILFSRIVFSRLICLKTFIFHIF